MKHKKKIYKTTNLLNGKVYVGKSIHNNKSYLGGGVCLRRAMQKYGKENFVCETVVEGYFNNNLLNELERHYIRIYSPPISKKSYNISPGGDGGSIAQPKKVCQYTLNGKFIKRWENCKHVEQELNINSKDVHGCCNDSQYTCKGFIFLWESDDISKRIYKIKQGRLKMSQNAKERFRKIKPLQYTIDGKFIKKWKCVLDAADSIKVDPGPLRMCLYDKTFTCKGFIWALSPLHFKTKFNNYNNRITNKRKIQVFIDNNIAAVVSTLKEAAELSNYSISSVSAILQSRMKPSKFNFKYIDNEN